MGRDGSTTMTRASRNGSGGRQGGGTTNSSRGSTNNSGGASGGGGGGGGGASNGGSRQDKNRSSRRRKGSRKKKVDPKVFWGDPEQLAAVPTDSAAITAKPSAVVQSLGRPPLSNQANAAEHYFAAVYDRAVNLAAALAAAGGLLDAGDLAGDREPPADD